MALKKNPLIVVCNNKVKKKKRQQIILMTRLKINDGKLTVHTIKINLQLLGFRNTSKNKHLISCVKV
jgi:hypothetical protein